MNDKFDWGPQSQEEEALHIYPHALRRIVDHLAALVPVVHNGASRRVRERHHAILAELSRLLP